jgi:hypothetical protein
VATSDNIAAYAIRFIGSPHHTRKFQFYFTPSGGEMASPKQHTLQHYQDWLTCKKIPNGRESNVTPAENRLTAPTNLANARSSVSGYGRPSAHIMDVKRLLP